MDDENAQFQRSSFSRVPSSGDHTVMYHSSVHLCHESPQRVFRRLCFSPSCHFLCSQFRFLGGFVCLTAILAVGAQTQGQNIVNTYSPSGVLTQGTVAQCDTSGKTVRLPIAPSLVGRSQSVVETGKTVICATARCHDESTSSCVSCCFSHCSKRYAIARVIVMMCILLLE